MVEKAAALEKYFISLCSGQSFVFLTNYSVFSYHQKTNSWSSLSALYRLICLLWSYFGSIISELWHTKTWSGSLVYYGLLLTFIFLVTLCLHLHPVHPRHMSYLLFFAGRHRRFMVYGVSLGPGMVALRAQKSLWIFRNPLRREKENVESGMTLLPASTPNSLSTLLLPTDGLAGLGVQGNYFSSLIHIILL